MSDELPTPPAELSIDIVDTLNGYSPVKLHHVARYAEELAEHKARDARLKDDHGMDDPPYEIPSKATITIEEINDNRSYNWQWRDGDRIGSKYKTPVAPDE